MQLHLLNKLSKPWQYVLSLGLIVFVSVLSYFLSEFIGYKIVALILLLTVSVIAMFFDILPVLFAACLSALTWNFFFIPPKFNFYISQPEDVLMFLMYFFVALVNAVLNYKSRQWEKLARKKEEKSNTLKLYNSILNSLSHELRTPIATIIGSTDNLKTDYEKLSGTDKEELLNAIAKSALRLNTNVENLLNMSRLESGVISPVKDWFDINDLIHDVKNRLTEYSSYHKLQIQVNENLPLFNIDFGLINQCVYNIAYNALIYTPQNSQVIIRASKYQNSLLIEIEDNGPGFPEKEIENVFDKFYRLKTARTGGTGLGLSIVKGFVEAHGGNVKLENVKPHGAKFTLLIPAQTLKVNDSKNEQ